MGPKFPPVGGSGRGQCGSEAGPPESLRSGFLSQEGMVPGSSPHGKQQKRHPREARGGTKGVPGRVSCRVGDLCGCSPGARPGLGSASSLAQAQTTLTPILRAFPGFLSRGPHPGPQRGGALRRPPQKPRVFWGDSGQAALACLVAFGYLFSSKRT